MAERIFNLFYKKFLEIFLETLPSVALYHDDVKDDKSNDVHTGRLLQVTFLIINPSQGGDWWREQGGTGPHQGGDDRTGEAEEGGLAPSDFLDIFPLLRC